MDGNNIGVANNGSNTVADSRSRNRLRALLNADPEEVDVGQTKNELYCKEKESDINNVNKIIESFTHELSENTDLRKKYSYIIFGLLAIQILALNAMIFFWGFDRFKIDNPTIFYWFLTLVVGEIIGFVLIIVKYLFKPTDDILKEMIKLLKKQSEIS